MTYWPLDSPYFNACSDGRSFKSNRGIQRNRSKTTSRRRNFLLRRLGRQTAGGRRILLLEYTISTSHVLFFKTLCAAQRKRRFFDHKGLSTCPKPWKSRFLRFCNFWPDLDPHKSFIENSYGHIGLKNTFLAPLTRSCINDMENELVLLSQNPNFRPEIYK